VNGYRELKVTATAQWREIVWRAPPISQSPDSRCCLQFVPKSVHRTEGDLTWHNSRYVSLDNIRVGMIELLCNREKVESKYTSCGWNMHIDMCETKDYGLKETFLLYNVSRYNLSYRVVTSASRRNGNICRHSSAPYLCRTQTRSVWSLSTATCNDVSPLSFRASIQAPMSQSPSTHHACSQW
jgi:hypothetical protein